MNFLNTAIFSRLSGATALTNLLGGTFIYAVQAPKGAAPPYVVFSLAGGGDENDSPHRTKNDLVFARAYASSNAQAGSIDAQIDTALHMNPFTGVSGWTNFWMAREQDMEVPETDPAGNVVYMSGGTYRVRFEQT